MAADASTSASRANSIVSLAMVPPTSMTCCGAPPSAGATSDSSDTSVYPHQPRPPEGAARHHDGEEVVRDDDRGDQACDDTNSKRDGETLHSRRAYEAEDHARDQRRRVGVANGRPG